MRRFIEKWREKFVGSRSYESSCAANPRESQRRWSASRIGRSCRRTRYCRWSGRAKSAWRTRMNAMQTKLKFQAILQMVCWRSFSWMRTLKTHQLKRTNRRQKIVCRCEHQLEFSWSKLQWQRGSCLWNSVDNLQETRRDYGDEDAELFPKSKLRKSTHIRREQWALVKPSHTICSLHNKTECLLLFWRCVRHDCRLGAMKLIGRTCGLRRLRETVATQNTKSTNLRCNHVNRFETNRKRILKF